MATDNIKIEPTDTIPATSKAQRAARRDMVNARRDKRKAQTTPKPSPSPTASTKKQKTNANCEPPLDVAAMVASGELDKAGEERLRAMEAQLEQLDPDSKEAKKKRRLIRNRMSAQLHRERKKAYVGQLEDQLQQKEEELQRLKDRLDAMTQQSSQLQQQLQSSPMSSDATPIKCEESDLAQSLPSCLDDVFAPSVFASSDSPLDVDEVVIKDEPMLELGTNDWMQSLDGLEDSEDLLSDFDYPFGRLESSPTPTPEIHAAKKNLAMMMAMMFSVTFCGNGTTCAGVASGSNMESMFTAHQPRDLSQMNVASRIMASLDKTSWKSFRDVSSWAYSPNEENVQVASPSNSDVTDASCSSPSLVNDCFELGSDDFMYPLSDPLVDTEWTRSPRSTNDFELKKRSNSNSPSWRMYKKLTALWQEKSQVLCAVKDAADSVTRRAVADMSTIRNDVANGKLFASGDASGLGPKVDEEASVSFLYPMSAFQSEASENQMFLEVSCNLRGQ